MAGNITTKILLELFKPDKPLVIFDIGACDAEDSIKYAEAFPCSSVYAFEPVLENISKIKENLKKTNLKNVFVEEKALSDKDGRCVMHISSGQPKDAAPGIDYGNKSSSILKSGKANDEVFPWLKFKEEREINCLTLKTFCQEKNIGNVDFIHMDVQGAELLVLQGAKDKLQNIKAIWLEVSNMEFYENQPLEKEVRRFLLDKGFRLAKNESFYHRYGDQLYLNGRYFGFLKIKFMQLKDLLRIFWLIFKNV